MRTDSETLRRRKAFLCQEDFFAEMWAGDSRESQLSRQRTEKDWSEVTVPVDVSGLELETMPEQYPGASRAAIRAFIDSGAKRAVVRDADPVTLNQSIAVLGFHGEVYAETRDGKTVLRKVAKERV